MNANSVLDWFENEDFFYEVFNGISKEEFERCNPSQIGKTYSGFDLSVDGIYSESIFKLSEESTKAANLKSAVIFLPNKNHWIRLYDKDIVKFAKLFVFENESDWRVPTIDELFKLIDNESKKDTVVKLGEKNAYSIFSEWNCNGEKIWCDIYCPIKEFFKQIFHSSTACGTMYFESVYIDKDTDETKKMRKQKNGYKVPVILVRG